MDATPTKLAGTTINSPPSPAKLAGRNPFSSPTFEFKMTRPSTELSPEARKLMHEVREQAAKIKAELVVQRDEQLSKEGVDDALHGYGGRRIAQPKGKVGRFSDVHLEQFKKMDSIANHPSSFRADAARLTPAKSLKRSNSRAELDTTETSVKQSTSKRPDVNVVVHDSPPSPVKRFKLQNGLRMTPLASQSKSNTTVASPGTPTARVSRLTTPTKASLGRSASVKSLGKTISMIPSLARSSSSKDLATPSTSKVFLAQTEGNHKFRNAFTNKLTSVRSILKRPQIKFSDDPVQLAAGTHMLTPRKDAGQSSTNFDKSLPSLPEPPRETPNHREEKHVKFTASSNLPSSPLDPIRASPTPMKIKYPALPGLGSPLTNRLIPGSAAKTGDFTFRSGSPIRFGKGSESTPTIRRVRTSGVEYPKIPPLPDLRNPSATIASPAKDFAIIPVIPHGLQNKKRKRDSEDATAAQQEDKENVTAFGDVNGEKDEDATLDEQPAKRARTMTITKVAVTPRSPIKTRTRTGAAAGRTSMATSSTSRNTVAKAKGKGFLSLSRLNTLAMPKNKK